MLYYDYIIINISQLLRELAIFMELVIIPGFLKKYKKYWVYYVIIRYPKYTIYLDKLRNSRDG